MMNDEWWMMNDDWWLIIFINTTILISLDSFSVVIIPIILKIEEDIRERVLYLAHLFLDSTIHDYIPTNEDVNYPQKLYGMIDDWWLMIDDWWLMNDDWWLMNDDWWLMNDDWWLMNDEWWLMNDDWWLMIDDWWLMIDEWWLMNDGWWMMNDDWWLMIDDWWMMIDDGKSFNKIGGRIYVIMDRSK